MNKGKQTSGNIYCVTFQAATSFGAASNKQVEIYRKQKCIQTSMQTVGTNLTHLEFFIPPIVGANLTQLKLSILPKLLFME